MVTARGQQQRCQLLPVLAGQLAQHGGHLADEPVIGPGCPRGVYLGHRVEFVEVDWMRREPTRWAGTRPSSTQRRMVRADTGRYLAVRYSAASGIQAQRPG